MKKLTSFLGYLAAAFAILIMIGTVGGVAMGMGPWIVEAGSLKTSPNWTGGEVARTVDHGSYTTEIHRPVFDALIGEHKEGFVQVAWGEFEALPETIDEDIDYDGDGQADFGICLVTAAKQAELTAYSPNVLELVGVYRLNEKMAVRVRLMNKR
jgi:hypothetical protein